MLNIDIVGLLDDVLDCITTVINSAVDWYDAGGGCFHILNAGFRQFFGTCAETLEL